MTFIIKEKEKTTREHCGGCGHKFWHITIIEYYKNIIRYRSYRILTNDGKKSLSCGELVGNCFGRKYISSIVDS